MVLLGFKSDNDQDGIVFATLINSFAAYGESIRFFFLLQVFNIVILSLAIIFKSERY